MSEAGLRVAPCSLEQANAYIRRVHRHHGSVLRAKFYLAAVDGETGVVHGVVTIGRPVARMLDDGQTLEVTRCATDGTRNACSLLYAAARRVALAMGYHRVLTYTLAEESGASLRADGWKLVEEHVKGRSWHTPTQKRPRKNTHATFKPKCRWEVVSNREPLPTTLIWPSDTQVQLSLFVTEREAGGAA